MSKTKRALACALSFLMVWSLFGYVFPSYADQIDAALNTSAGTCAVAADQDANNPSGIIQSGNGSITAEKSDVDESPITLDTLQENPKTESQEDSADQDDPAEQAGAQVEHPDTAGAQAEDSQAGQQGPADGMQDGDGDSGDQPGDGTQDSQDPQATDPQASQSEEPISAQGDQPSEEPAGDQDQPSDEPQPSEEPAGDQDQQSEEPQQSDDPAQDQQDSQPEDPDATQGEPQQDEPAAEQKDDGTADEESLEDDKPEDSKASVYADGFIHIATYQQLVAVGSNAAATTSDREEGGFGTGEPILDDKGNAVTYASDVAYYLDCDIQLPVGAIWQLPADFSGPADADATRIFDAESDTVYIQNPYQLDILSSKKRDEMPVMTGDVAAETFGSGNLVYKDGDDKFVAYDDSHAYVISAAFTADRGTLKMLKVTAPTKRVVSAKNAVTGTNDDYVCGRDYFGQVTKTIGNTTYILIGDRQQLDALNMSALESTDSQRIKVSKPVYVVEQHRPSIAGNGSDDWSDKAGSTPQIYYPGDADLIAGLHNTTEDDGNYSQKPLMGFDNSDYQSLGGHLHVDRHERDYYFTVVDGGNPTNVSDGRDATSNLYVGTYSGDANYIVFRDIDMKVGYRKTSATSVYPSYWENDSDHNWRPLMFSGVMYGIKSDEVGGLWNNNTLNPNKDAMPTISNAYVKPSTARALDTQALAYKDYLDLSEQTAVGFFGTLSGGASSLDNLREDTTVVNNIRIADSTVVNDMAKAYVPQTLVSGLLTVVGGTLGLAVNTLIGILTGTIFDGTNDENNLTNTLKNLLNARAQDPTSLSTGGFVGHVKGAVQITDCEAKGVTVQAVTTASEGDGLIVGKGGFAGSVDGEAQYSGLSQLLETLTGGLAGVLNLIPGIGLGDLVTILLEQLLDAGKLIPTAYVTPEIIGCTVDGTDSSGSRVSLLANDADKIGVGGFVGAMSGTVMQDCEVKNATYSVAAKYFGGGFAGVERDGQVPTTLDGLLGEGSVLSAIHPQSELLGCKVSNSKVSVSGDSLLGGFVGAQANSYAINCVMGDCSESPSTPTVQVNGTGDYVGGFTGIGTVGTALSSEMTGHVPTSGGLLGAVSGVANSLLAGDKKTNTALLSVAGVSPSAVLGCQILGTLKVRGQNYVGGIVGQGDGMTIAKSSTTNISNLLKYKGTNSASLPSYVTDANYVAQENLVARLQSVSATTNYAGGVAGYLTPANVAGLLSGSLGIQVGQLMEFTVTDTTVRGDGGASGNGYEVKATQDYAGGAIGWATGGRVQDVNLEHVGLVQAGNHAGGFVGATGPGDIASGGGLSLKLLGLEVLKIDDLLSVAATLRTTYVRANVTGVDKGFVVEQTSAGEETINYVAGGWAAEANSVTVVDSKVDKLKSVRANLSHSLVRRMQRYLCGQRIRARRLCGWVCGRVPERQAQH